MSARLDEALDALFAVPVDAFLGKRAELVAALRDAGDKQAAMAVKARSKPTLAAHALNQVPRVAGAELEKLLAAGRKLAAGKEFKESLEEQRAALEALRAKLPAAHMSELVSVLRGAMADPALATLVREGRFSKIPEVAVGFFGAAPSEGPRLQVVRGGKSAAIAPAATPRKGATAEPTSTATPKGEAASKGAEKRAAAANADTVAPPKRLKTLAERHAEEAKARAAERAEKAARERAERKARELAEAKTELKRLTAEADAAERAAAQARRAAKMAADRVRAMEERE